MPSLELERLGEMDRGWKWRTERNTCVWRVEGGNAVMNAWCWVVLESFVRSFASKVYVLCDKMEILHSGKCFVGRFGM